MVDGAIRQTTAATFGVSEQPARPLRYRHTLRVIAILWALGCAIGVAIVLALIRRPREAAIRYASRLRAVFSLLEHENHARAIERIAGVLTQDICNQEGNPDDEYRSDWYRWLTGDPEANVDYSRKQQRDLERLRSGAYRSGQRPSLTALPRW